jgi:hypothetical protein
VRRKKLELLVVPSVGIPEKNDRFPTSGKLLNERPDYRDYLPCPVSAIQGAGRVEKII